ncbi:MAG: MATE family efflux transporter [Coprococcus sp.]|jgi:MATE efflux family protein
MRELGKKQKIDRSHYLFDNKALTALIIPLIVEQLLAVLVGMADSIMVANVGEAAVSGVSLVDNIMVLLINIFAALATGGAVVAGQYLGQKREKDACIAAKQLIWFIFLCSVGITAIVYLGRNFILHSVFGAIDADVMSSANTYLMIVTASIPFIALYNGGAAIFRAMGNSKVSMQVSIVMNVINVAGNAILIYGFHRGTEGVAIPTLVSRMVAAILILGLLCNQTRVLHLEKTLRYHLNGSMVKRILNIGVPNGLENSMFQLGKILVLSLVSTFGTSAIAANAVSNAVALFQILPGMAISLAVTTVISRCVGAGDYEQAKYYTRKLLKITYCCMAVTVALIFAVLPLIMKVYNLSAGTSAESEKILLFHGCSAILVWPIAFNLPAVFRASGDVRYSMITSIVSMWIFRIAFSYILGKYMGIGVFGVWIAMIIDWCFRAILFVYRYFSGKWQGRSAV